MTPPPPPKPMFFPADMIGLAAFLLCIAVVCVGWLIWPERPVPVAPAPSHFSERFLR